MEILKVSGIVWMQRTLFSRHFLWKKCLGTVQYHEQRQRLVCALYTYLQSLSLLVKLSDLLLMANLAKMSLFTHLVAFWRNVVIYALCRILVKCRDLRIFPGKKFRIPGTKNYYAALSTTFKISLRLLYKEKLLDISFQLN